MSAWDIKGLSKELVDGLISKAGKQKDVLVEAVIAEVGKYLKSMDLPGELHRLVDDLTIDVNATIMIKKRKGEGGHQHKVQIQMQEKASGKARKKS